MIKINPFSSCKILYEGLFHYNFKLFCKQIIFNLHSKEQFTYFADNAFLPQKINYYPKCVYALKRMLSLLILFLCASDHFYLSKYHIIKSLW